MTSEAFLPFQRRRHWRLRPQALRLKQLFEVKAYEEENQDYI